MEALQKKLRNVNMDDSVATLALLSIHKGLREGKTSISEILSGVNEENASQYANSLRNLVNLVSQGNGVGKVVLMVQLLKADDSNLNESEKQIKKNMTSLLNNILGNDAQLKGKNSKVNILLMNILLECYADVFCSKLHSQEAERGAQMANTCNDIASLLLNN